MGKKTFCAVCHGDHFSMECPRLEGNTSRNELVPGGAPPPLRCPNCEALEAEVVVLKRKLAEVTKNQASVTQIRDVTEIVTKRRGRPKAAASLTHAERQRAYRQRRADGRTEGVDA